MLLIENEMPINKVAKIVGVYANRIWRVFSYWIEKAHTSDEISVHTKDTHYDLIIQGFVQNVNM